MKKCMVDMDGVLTDFNLACLTFFKIDPDDIHFKKGSWDTTPAIQNHLGMSANQFWSSLKSPFWEHMPQTNNYSFIIQQVQEHFGSNFWIVSSPANEESAHGKILWLKRCLPDVYRDGRFALCRNKICCAAPNHLLIDDGDHNVEAFRKAGGKAVLYPTPFNKLWELTQDNLSVIQRFKIDLQASLH